MLTYQCSVCRHTITLADHETIGKCPQCGSVFVVPNQFRDNANKQNIYRLANEALANRNFDVALTYYKRILMVDAKETAAHWGFLLSKYGVEISAQSATYQHVIFHRIEQSIFTEDPSYEKMLTYCPRNALYYFQGLSRIIEQQQRKMLRIAQNQQPFDIYLNCTAAPGTADYLLANQVGLALDQAGYRVFLPATMLANVPAEDKNLHEMAVLEKAQAMIVVATDSTNHADARYTAAWKRFFAYRRQDAGRKMLSVFQRLLPEQLPLELQPLQSIKCEGAHFQEEVLSKINEMFGRKNQDISITRKILEYLRQAEENLAAGQLDRAALLYRQVRELDAEEAKAHWGLVVCGTRMMTTPVFSETVLTDYQRTLQFAQGPQKELYQKTMCALMAEPAWNQLLQLTDNLRNTQISAQKAVREAVANARMFLAKDDPRLRKIEDYYAAAKAQKEAIELKNAYERRDIVTEPLFAEQSKAESAYNACGNTDGRLLNAFRRTVNLLLIPMLLLLAGQLALVHSFSYSLDYEGPAYFLARFLFICAVGCFAVLAFLIYYGIADDQDWPMSFGVIAIAAVCIATYFLYRKHTKIIFLVFLAITSLLWVLLRMIAIIRARTLKSNAVLLKKATQQIKLINAQIQESYALNMQAHFERYGIKNPVIPEYTVQNSPDFEFRFETRQKIRPTFIIISSVVTLLAMILGATAVSNALYAKGWENIVSLTSGGYHIVGLREDGTCIANGRNKFDQCEVSQWRNVKQIEAGMHFTAGLLEDGTVVLAGDPALNQADVAGWKDIVMITASRDHLVGLKKDGSCVAVGSNINGECDMSQFQDVAIVRAVTGGKGSITVGVTKEGKIIATAIEEWNGIREYLGELTGSGQDQIKVTKLYGDYGAMIAASDDGRFQPFGTNNNEQLRPVESWNANEFKQIYVCNFTVGLKHDGTAEFAGQDSAAATQVTTWEDVQYMSGSDTYVLGLKKDGTVCAIGNNKNGQCSVDEWEGIRDIYAADLTSYGIKEDGTVVAAGYNIGGLTYTTPLNPFELLEYWLSL